MIQSLTCLSAETDYSQNSSSTLAVCMHLLLVNNFTSCLNSAHKWPVHTLTALKIW